MHLKKYYRVRTADATTFFLRLLTSVRSKKVKYESVLNTPCMYNACTIEEADEQTASGLSIQPVPLLRPDFQP